MTIKAKDGYVTINTDLCMSYCDSFGARVLRAFIQRRSATSGSRLERFQEEMKILRAFLIETDQQVELVF